MPEEFENCVDIVAGIAATPTLLEVVCRTTGMGFAAIAHVTPSRWIACGVRDEIGFGLKPGGELMVGSALCQEIRDQREPIVIDHADDERFRHTPLLSDVRSYLSMPIILRDGSFFGTLCAIDPQPRRLSTPHTLGMFRLFAELIAFHIDAHQHMTRVAASLAEERENSELRNRFIGVLGHDLKNPLAAIEAGVRLLTRKELDAQSRMLVGHMQNSVDRMSELIDNVLDFARGLFAGGLPIERRADAPLLPTLQTVIDEMRAAHPDRIFDLDLRLESAVDCDSARIGQLFSNLVSNALRHGAPGEAVSIRAHVEDKTFRIIVSNKGDAVPPETAASLFKPFYRGDAANPSAKGLGLGLYISQLIARGHGGGIELISDEGGTHFAFSMPLRN